VIAPKIYVIFTMSVSNALPCGAHAGDVAGLGHNTKPKQNAIRYLWVMAAAARLIA
jgi:hypothetical protein